MKKFAIVLAVMLGMFCLNGAAFADTIVQDTVPKERETVGQYEKALAHYNKGEYQKSINILTDYIKTTPDPWGYWLMGYSLYKLKRFDEANRYFKDAFLVDPSFSPTPTLEKELKHPYEPARPLGYPEGMGPSAGPTPMPRLQQGTIVITDSGPVRPQEQQRPITPSMSRQAPSSAVGGLVPLTPIREEAPPPPPAQEPVPAPQTEQVAQAPAQPEAPQEAVPPPPAPGTQAPVPPPAAQAPVPAPQTAPAPAPAQPEAPQQATPPPPPAPKPAAKPAPKPVTRPAPSQPLPWGELDKLSPFFNIFAGLSMMSILVPFLIFYLFFSYCYYRIARKVGVSAPWLAFVPILQIWTLFACAGKSTGMTILLLILLFVPLVNIIVIIYVWMMIAENLGKNKWIGLLILVPFVNIILPIWFAFSRGGGAVSRGEAGGMGELADLGGEPDIPDLDFDLEEEEAPSKGKEETPQYEDDWQLPDEETGGGQKADDWQLPTETDEGEQSVGDWQLPEEEQ